MSTAGIIQADYRDALGRVQTYVEGPGGHYLVTRGNRYEPYEIWLSNGLKTSAYEQDKEKALAIAHRLASKKD